VKRLPVWGFGLIALAGPPIAVLQSNGLAALAVLAASLVLLGLFARGQAAALWHDPLVLMIVLLIAWMLLTGIWALVPANAWSTLYGLGPVMLSGAVLVVGARMLDVEEIPRVSRWLLIGYAALIALLAVELLTGGLVAGAYDAVRRTPSFWAVTMLSRGVVLAILLSWACAVLLLRRGRPWVAGLALAAAAAVTFGSGSYAGRVAVLAGMAAFCVVLLLRRRGVVAMLGLLLAFSATIPLLPQGPLDPEANASWLGPLRNSGLHRLYIWRFAAERVAEHPLRGWGLDAARSMPGGEAPTPVGGQVMMMHPHNGPLQVWLELGFPGIVALLILLMIAGRALLRSKDDLLSQAGLTAALMAGFAILCLGFGIWQTWWVGVMGMTAGWLAVAARAALENPPRP